jgi:hypothetical protein
MTIMYVCDKKACGKICPNEDCNYTSNIKHAINFNKIGGGKNLTYIENKEIKNGGEKG